LGVFVWVSVLVVLVDVCVCEWGMRVWVVGRFGVEGALGVGANGGSRRVVGGCS